MTEKEKETGSQTEKQTGRAGEADEHQTVR